VGFEVVTFTPGYALGCTLPTWGRVALGILHKYPYKSDVEAKNLPIDDKN